MYKEKANNNNNVLSTFRYPLKTELCVDLCGVNIWSSERLETLKFRVALNLFCFILFYYYFLV